MGTVTGGVWVGGFVATVRTIRLASGVHVMMCDGLKRQSVVEWVARNMNKKYGSGEQAKQECLW